MATHREGLDWVGIITGKNKDLAEKRMKYHQPVFDGYKLKLFRLDNFVHTKKGYKYDVYVVLENNKWVKTK
jgi:hypothetical protein